MIAEAHFLKALNLEQKHSPEKERQMAWAEAVRLSIGSPQIANTVLLMEEADHEETRLQRSLHAVEGLLDLAPEGVHVAALHLQRTRLRNLVNESRLAL